LLVGLLSMAVALAPTILDFARARAGRKEDGASLVPVMLHKRDFLGRGLDLEAYFTPDITEDPEDPPLNYLGVRTDRYLYAEYGTGEQELYDLRADPFELQNAATNPAYSAVKGSLRRLLSSEAGCAGRGCRLRPALNMGCATARARGSPARASLRRQPSTCAARRSGETASRRSGYACRTHPPVPGSRRWRPRSTGESSG
jgi:N-sulphoglucosamine sulphohydrolase, C-terminal